jgi:ADP-ribose pyrophosphatase YjhB (NUDIX family)
MLGAGMVLIQENTHKIVVIYETQKQYWFFPRGRKDIGESLEHTALREAYEEVSVVSPYPFFNKLSILMQGVWTLVWLSCRVYAALLF